MNIFLIIFSITFFVQAYAEKRLRIHIIESTSWSDNNILNYTELINEAEPSFSFEFKVNKKIPDIDFHIEGYVRHKDNEKYYGKFNGTYSLCRILAYKNASPLAGLVFAHLKSYGNIPDNCPIKEDTYGMKKIWFGDHASNLNLPEFNVDLRIQAFVVDKELIKILDNVYKAEGVNKEVSSANKKAGGLLSMLG